MLRHFVASAAMHAMNGAVFGSKQIVVRLHEPKQLRQEKLAQRFGHNGHPRSASGATSPTASEGGESYVGFSSPRHPPSALGSPIIGHDRSDRGRRSSGSYYNVGDACTDIQILVLMVLQAALSGTLNLPMRYDDLAALSPVVRKEVLTGELSRRIKANDSVPADEVDVVVESLTSLALSEVVGGLHDPAKLATQIASARTSYKGSFQSPSPAKSPSPAASQDSRVLDANALNATASAPEHPSTPISISASISTPPRTSSPSGSVPPISEKDRMAAAVAKLESSRQSELTELLMSLPKRERAMCLFNVEVLRTKIADAKVVLDCSESEEERRKPEAEQPPPPVPVTPQAKKSASGFEGSPQTPALSSRGPSAASSPTPATPGSSTHTIASLARLPAAEIIKLASTSSITGLPVPKPDPLVVQATDEFIDGLLDKPIQAQKQQLGDKLCVFPE